MLSAALIVGTVQTGPASAQEAEAAGRSGIPDGAEAAVVGAVTRSSPVRTDGRLDEPAWDRAPIVDDFVQSVPREGAQPARPTEVRVLYDRDALYIGARMYDEAGAIYDQLVRRDGSGAFDYFRLEIDPNRDRLTGYLFQVSAAGVQRDGFLYDDTRVDDAYDAVWSSAVRKDTLGWSAELRIPLSQIDFPTADTARTWGINLVRRRLASSSESMVALRSRRESGRVSQYGELRGVRLPDGGRALELLPHVALRGRLAPAAPDDPFFDGASRGIRSGMDVRWSFRSNFTLDATVNPDFGQVEVDPAVVNLTAFETFFPEKRPFFAQDARIFDFPLSGPYRTLFHSRRIGRRPRRGAPDDADFADVPDVTSILGAAKVTGRLASGTSVGVLGAVTGEETGRAFRRESGTVERFMAQPAARYGVARVRQDLREGASHVGAILGGVHRALPGSGEFDHLTGTAMAGGVDFEHQWGGPRSRRYALWGYFSGSYVAGSPKAIATVQTNANHYFQRPDAAYKDVDSTATEMLGREWRLQLERRSAEHWLWAAWVNEVSPGYVIDDIGFAGSTLPRIDVGGRVRYQDVTPGRWLRSWVLTFDTFHNFRHSSLQAPLSAATWTDAHQSGRSSLSGRFDLHNDWSVRLAGRFEPPSLTERETRGGPLVRVPAALGLSGTLSTDRRSSVNAIVRAGHRDRHRAGSRSNASIEIEWRPSPRWDVRVGPSWERHRDAAQYVATTDAVPFGATGGKRYLFADVLREQVAMTSRVDLAVTPDLSLQSFLQPLLSSVDFTGYKQLERGGTFLFQRFGTGRAETRDAGVACVGGRTCVADGRRYIDFDGGIADLSFDDRDFRLASFRGNVVLRWEYAPGSEAFAVWQHDRRFRRAAAGLSLADDADTLFGTQAENVVMIKVRHRFSF